MHRLIYRTNPKNFVLFITILRHLKESEICCRTENLGQQTTADTFEIRRIWGASREEKTFTMHDHMRVRHAQINKNYDKLNITEQDCERLQYLT
jgi:hypothetical protein